MAPRPGLVARHIITRYVHYATEPGTGSGAAASAGAGSEYPLVGPGADAVDGIRLVTEWAYVGRILGEELDSGIATRTDPPACLARAPLQPPVAV